MAEEVCWVTLAKLTSKKLEGSGEKSRSDKGKGWCRAFTLCETVSLTPKHRHRQGLHMGVQFLPLGMKQTVLISKNNTVSTIEHLSIY